jgi:hypothetical protein
MGNWKCRFARRTKSPPRKHCFKHPLHNTYRVIFDDISIEVVDTVPMRRIITPTEGHPGKRIRIPATPARPASAFSGP